MDTMDTMDTVDMMDMDMMDKINKIDEIDKIDKIDTIDKKDKIDKLFEVIQKLLQFLFSYSPCRIHFYLRSIIRRILWVSYSNFNPPSIWYICLVVVINRRGIVCASPEHVHMVPTISNFVKIVKVESYTMCYCFQMLKN